MTSRSRSTVSHADDGGRQSRVVNQALWRGLSGHGSVICVGGGDDHGLSRPERRWQEDAAHDPGAGSLGSLAGVFSALAGVLLVTSEYRFGTIRPTILFNPERSQVPTAKVLAGVLAGIAFGVLGEAIGWAIAYAILDGRGITRRAQQRRHSAAHARRARRRGLVGARSAPVSGRSSTTKSAASSRYSPGASSSTTSCSASSVR